MQTFAGVTPWDATQQQAATALVLFEIRRAHLHGHAARHLGHRCQQRQRVVAVADRLIRNAGDLLGQQRIGQLRQRRQVQIGEQRQVRAKEAVLLLDGLLHLHDHIGHAPHVVSGADDLRAGGLIVVVGEGREFARVRLHQHLMACLAQRLHARGRDPDAGLVVFDFLRYSDDHAFSGYELRSRWVRIDSIGVVNLRAPGSLSE